MTDKFDSNRQVAVNGEAADLIPVKYLFRDFAVPAGSRRVMFSYRPVSFYLGAAIYFFAALLITSFYF